MSSSIRAHFSRSPVAPSQQAVLLEPCGSSASLEAMLDLAAFWEGNLSAAGQLRLVAHLARCRTCRSVLVSLAGEPPAAPRPARDRSDVAAALDDAPDLSRWSSLPDRVVVPGAASSP